jgi:hypothetical protein
LRFFDKLKSQGLLREEVDSRCAQLSFFAMMVFPFIAPDMFLNNLGITLSPEFLQKHAEQNIRLLNHGVFKSPPEHRHTPSSEPNHGPK